jgi:hypothetical protein
MTAEVAIMNKAGIALAADSAVTISQDRVWKNSNKLFHLSLSSDVAVMFYGNGDFCGIPWEILIKEFRKKFLGAQLPHLRDYVRKFLDFLDEINAPETLAKNISSFYLIMSTIDDTLAGTDTNDKLKRRKQIVARAKRLLNDAEQEEILIGDYTIRQYREIYGQNIKDLLKDKINNHVTREMYDEVSKLCFARATRAFRSAIETGLVFAGFGEDELLPVLIEVCVDGELAGVTRSWNRRMIDMNVGDTNSAIIPFAQSDIAQLFMEGSLPDYIKYAEDTMLRILDEKSDELIKNYVPATDQIVEKELQRKANALMIEKFSSKYSEFRQKEVNKVLKVVNSLPKEEMAAMAEALVEITSLRRKMDSKLETVGGPVDVAIVSKSDGFVWIKRKYYFDKEINPDFSERRRKRNAGGKNGTPT